MFFEDSFFGGGFDFNKKADLIKNIQALMKCPNCGASYNSSGIQILGQMDSIYVVHLDCIKCGMPVMSTVVLQEKEALSAPKIKLKKELGKKITSDDVLDFHNFLEKFDGDFESAIKD